MKTIFLRVLEADDKAAALKVLIAHADATQDKKRFEVEPTGFAAIPRSPFAYWLSERLRRLFVEVPSFESSGRGAIGASTKNDFRYIRLATEVAPSDIAQSRTATYLRPWVPLSKGGIFSNHFADIYLIVNWKDDGHELKADISEYRGERGWGYQWSAALNGHSDYFRPGLTWPRRRNGLSFRVMPAGCIFGDKGPAVFVANNESDSLLALSAIVNSCVFAFLVSLQLARTDLAQSYEVGIIHSTPVPQLKASDRAKLSSFARRAWSLKRYLDTRREISHAFNLPALLQVVGDTLATRAEAWADRVRGVDAGLMAIQAEIDQCSFDLYGIDDDDRRQIADAFGGTVGAVEVDPDGDDTRDEGEPTGTSDMTRFAEELASWAVGVTFGRFDICLATGSRVPPPEPEPFDLLPVCSSAMLTGEDGLPLTVLPTSYPVDVSAVLVDDPGHPLDLSSRVRSVFDAVFQEGADVWWTDVGIALGTKESDLRSWLSRDFFDYHLKMYSRSRRKAPILWPIGTKTGSYAVWLYAHQASSDSLFQILNDLVAPKLAVEERRLTQMRLDVGTDPTASQRKAMDTQERFVGELRELREELEAVAPLWAPYLNDGIVIVLAPLWRLFAHHRAWSSELKKHWVKLATGDYDWAQLAMRLWPERVVPKCAIDRSLAIAHGLEDVFWVQDPANEDRWLSREIPATPVEELIAQRHSPATIAAVQRVST